MKFSMITAAVVVILSIIFAMMPESTPESRMLGVIAAFMGGILVELTYANKARRVRE